MHLSNIQWLLIYATFGLQIAVLTVMARKKFIRAFPWFFSSVAFSLLTNLVLEIAFLFKISGTPYFNLFWILIGVGALLAFAIVYEVFTHVLRPYSALVDLGKLLFRWAFVFVALASFLTALATNSSECDKMVAGIQLLERSSQLMLCGLLLLFVLFQSRLGLSWRSPSVCIMFGLGAYSALALARSFAEERFPNWAHSLDLLGAFAGVVIYAWWVTSFVLPQPARRTAQDSPTRLILQRWNEAVMASPLIARRVEASFSPIESFLPGVERTVERVMAQKMH